MHTQGRKIFIVGLDGLSLNILDQIKDEYDLVNIKNILDKGASGPLKSVLPYSSAPNWASLTTGVNPGKHGFYSFFFPKNNAYEHQFPNSTYIKTSRVWDLISSSGQKVLMLNVPATYPPSRTNGCMITGMLTPDINSNFAYPSSLTDEVREKFPDYSFDTNWTEYKDKGIDQLIDALLRSTETRRDLFFYLMEKYPADFTMMVFTETDRLFHSALHLIDKNHPHFDREAARRNKSKIMEIFRIIDASIGQIMSNYLNGGNIILLSDHGFSPVSKKVYLNNWLAKNELFYIRDDEENRIKSIIKSSVRGILGTLNISDKNINRLQAKLLSVLRENRGLPVLGGISKTIINKVDSMSYINWSRTQAYYLQEWGIRINLKGREPQGIVEEKDYEKLRDRIIELIKEFYDPELQRPIFKEALKREDVCFGDEFENAPDIFLITHDTPGYELTSDLSTKDIFRPMEWKTGDHSLFGIFFMWGDNIQNVSLDNLSVNDVVPTVLYALGLPIPEYMDGKVVTQAFSKDFLDNNRITADLEISGKSVQEEEFSDHDEEKVKDRLKGLGYL